VLDRSEAAVLFDGLDATAQCIILRLRYAIGGITSVTASLIVRVGDGRDPAYKIVSGIR